MLNYILFLNIVLTVYLFYNQSGRFRESILLAFLVFSVQIVLFAEVLSIFSVLNFPYLLTLWLMSTSLLAYQVSKSPAKTEKLQRLSKTIISDFSTYKFFCIPISLILLLTLFLALISPINNKDSLTYHLSRVMYWIQNEDLRHFATNNFRQVSYNIFSELAILHLVILGKSDFATNLVQWLSFLGVITCCTLIIERLGGKPKTQWLGAFLVASIPMVVLQATSTQNDLTVAFFVMTGVYFLLNYLQDKAFVNIVFFSFSLGLAELTKGTGYIFLFPFCVWLGLVMLFQASGWKKSTTWLGFATIILLSVGLNLGYYWRNWLIFHHPLGESSGGMSLDNHSLVALISNISRHLSLHIGIQSPGNIWNDFWTSQMLNLHQKLGIDISDPLTTFGINPSFKISRLNTSEDYAGNFLHFFLILVVSLIYLFQSKKQSRLSIFWLCSISTFVLFCALLRFQLFGSRLHTPFFLCMCCFTAMVIADKTRFIKILVISLSFGVLPFVFLNFQKPLLSFKALTALVQKLRKVESNDMTLALYQKKSILFSTYREVLTHEGLDTQATEFLNATEYLLKVPALQSVGLDIAGDDKDYIILRELVPKGIEVRWVGVFDPALVKLTKPDFKPNYIVSNKHHQNAIIYHQHSYKKVYAEQEVALYQIQNITSTK